MQWPDDNIIEETLEPLVNGSIICPTEYSSSVNMLCLVFFCLREISWLYPICLMASLKERRGIFKEKTDISSNRVIMKYVLPLNEIIVDFFDKLKSLTSGYARLESMILEFQTELTVFLFYLPKSFDYEHLGYEVSNLVKLTVSLNDDNIDELTQIVHASRVQQIARRFVEKLKEEVPRELYKIAIQAKVGSRVLARETVPAYRKDVTAKCYGGDQTRKRKLLKQQAEGQRRLREIGKIRLSKDVFINVLKK
jgi:translation elongation factor EF-4